MQSRSIVFVTHNKNKLEEARAVLSEPFLHLSTLSDYPRTAQLVDIPETGETFAENAKQKVDFIREYLTTSLVGDDSGLEVFALDGKPGVHSKRWISGTDADRNAYLLDKLSGHTDRRARFVTVLCFYDSETQQYHFFEGEVLGTIDTQVRGETGFGYDPLFIPDGFDQTFAQLGAEVKNSISHRARAFQTFSQFLKGR